MAGTGDLRSPHDPLSELARCNRKLRRAFLRISSSAPTLRDGHL
jgi:hypothetical protein